MGDQFLSSAGAGGICDRPMRLPDPSPVLDKNRAPMGPEVLSSTGAGVWEKGSYGISRLQFCTGYISVCENKVRITNPNRNLSMFKATLPRPWNRMSRIARF